MLQRQRLCQVLRDKSIAVSEILRATKEEYQNHIALKTNAKTYRSILKTFYNGKKVPSIPTILINNKLIPGFEVKANHFDIFFASACTPY